MSELDDFKAQLRAAGQPWSRWALWGIGSGIIILAIAQFAGQAYPSALVFFSILGVALVLFTGGWVLFVVAFVKRRQWARAHPIETVHLPELS